MFDLFLNNFPGYKYDSWITGKSKTERCPALFVKSSKTQVNKCVPSFNFKAQNLFLRDFLGTYNSSTFFRNQHKYLFQKALTMKQFTKENQGQRVTVQLAPNVPTIVFKIIQKRNFFFQISVVFSFFPAWCNKRL